jgi:hypothetical protein
MSREFTLKIGPDVAPGDYRLVTGFYRPDTGQRLLAPDSSSSAQIAFIHVAP